MILRTNKLAVALVFGLLGAGAAWAGEPQVPAQGPAGTTPMPLWEGKESTADYAKRVSLEPALTLDLGGGIKLELVLIPAGKFMMGSPDSEKYRFDNETQHEVTLSQPYYMGKYLVTQEQFEKVMGANPSHFKGAKNPVENVSWNGAQDFCKKLSATSGKTVRLPTEAEWEYACRAGSTTAYCFGDSENGFAEYSWYVKNSGGKTQPVGEKKPNAWGLYDMLGNVLEWCQDWYGPYPSGPVVDPVGPAVGSYRMLRGGSWCNYHAGRCRSADRYVIDLPEYRGYNSGFRVVVEVPPRSR